MITINSWSRIRETMQNVIALLQNRSGMAATEFALILPLMLFLYVGTIEASQGYSVSRRVTTVASSIGDLVAQTDATTPDELNDIYFIAQELMKPYIKVVQAKGSTSTSIDDERFALGIASVYFDEDQNPIVKWVYMQNMNLTAQDIIDALPEGLDQAISSVIVAKANFNYKSPFLGLVKAPFSKHDDSGITLSDTFYLRPRKSLEVECEDCDTL